MSTPQPQPLPITLSVAVGGLLTTGVALLAVFIPDLTQEAQIAIIGFGNAIILTGSVLWAQKRTTPIASPILDEGTRVTVITPEGEPDRVTTV